MINLKYHLNDAIDVSEYRLPADVLAELGITWERWESMTIVDQIWLYDCKNVPDKLPPFIERIDR